MLGARLRNLVAYYEQGRGFGGCNLGEQLAIALVLDRADVLAEYGCTYEQAVEAVGPLWMAAVDCLKEMRRKKNKPQACVDVANVKLARFDPKEKIARFYRCEISPTLFGDWMLVREWGRIGQSGQMRRDWFESEELAVAAKDKHVKKKMRKGYQAAV